MSSEVDGQDIRYVLLVGVALALLTALPYALGAVLSSPEMKFSSLVIRLEGGNSYLCNSCKDTRATGFTTCITHLSRIRGNCSFSSTCF